MIAAIGIKTRSIITARVSDPIVRKDVKSLATWGAGIYPILLILPIPPHTFLPIPYPHLPPTSTQKLQLIHPPSPPAIFVTGFLIWNIDTMACAQLTSIKRTIGMPWSFAFELHGWWHLFTGLGAYICASPFPLPPFPIPFPFSLFLRRCGVEFPY